MQCLVIREIASLTMSDRHAKEASFWTAMSEQRVLHFHSERYHLANKSQGSIAHERARKKTGFTQNLETVARTKHEFPSPRVTDHRFHDRRKARDRAATQIIAVSETAGQNDRLVIAER